MVLTKVFKRVVDSNKCIVTFLTESGVWESKKTYDTFSKRRVFTITLFIVIMFTKIFCVIFNLLISTKI